MFLHLRLVLFAPLAPLLSGPLGDGRDRQILALRQQVIVLKRRLAKRPGLSRAEKLALLLACARRKPTQFPGFPMIVNIATLIGWHRQIVRRHWTSQPQRGPGRPTTDPQAEQLVLRLARENNG